MRMRNGQVLAIDLGSAYTKIAVRQGWNVNAMLIRGTALSDGAADEDYCIPSVVARVRGNWIAGADAANQVRGPGVEVYRNWKAGLFASGASGEPEAVGGRRHSRSPQSSSGRFVQPWCTCAVMRISRCSPRGYACPNSGARLREKA